MDLCAANSRDFQKAFSYCHLKDITSQGAVQKTRKSSLLKCRHMNSDYYMEKQVCSSYHVDNSVECAMWLA